MILSAVLLLAIAAAHALLLPPSLATVPKFATRSFSARMALNDGDAIDVEAVSSSDDDDGRSSPPQPSTRRTADTTAAENEFLQFAGGEQRAAQIVDELEATGCVPDSPERLIEELLGYWGIRFTAKDGGFPPNGVTGTAPGDDVVVTGHFLRLAPSGSKEPMMQCVEAVMDTAIGKAQLSTLKGEYTAIMGATKNGRRGGRGLFGGRNKQASFTLAPSIEETYQKLDMGGEFQPDFRPGSVKRTWACTFIGERLLIARVSPKGGVAVYERLTESEVQSQIGRLLEPSPFGADGNMQQMMQQMMQGMMGQAQGGQGFPPGGWGNGPPPWGSGPSQRSNIP